MSTPPLPAEELKLGGAFKVDAQSEQAVGLMVGLLDLQDRALPIRRLREGR